MGSSRSAHRPKVAKRGPWRPWTSFALALLAGVMAWWFLSQFGWAVRIVGAWDALSATELLFIWRILRSAGPEETRRRALADDSGRLGVTAFILGASWVGLCMAMYLLREARRLPAGSRSALLGLCLWAVVNAWLLAHTAFCARYARLYYREGGLQLPNGSTPEYWDFAYFAFTIGMCFQVSDISITGSKVRKTTLGHALMSFAYNTSILALALNLIAELLGG